MTVYYVLEYIKAIVRTLGISVLVALIAGIVISVFLVGFDIWLYKKSIWKPNQKASQILQDLSLRFVVTDRSVVAIFLISFAIMGVCRVAMAMPQAIAMIPIPTSSPTPTATASLTPTLPPTTTPTSLPTKTPWPTNLPTPTKQPSHTPSPTIQPPHTATIKPSLTSEPTRTTLPTITATNLPASCRGAPPIRVKINDLARVTYTNGQALRLRSAPEIRSNNIIKKLPEGTQIKILFGPICSDNFAFWQVKEKSTGIKGWVAEGDSKNYFIEKIKTP